MEKTINSGPTPAIHLQAVGGSLVVRGWDKDTVQLRASQECRVQVENFSHASATTSASAYAADHTQYASEHTAENTAEDSTKDSTDNRVEIRIHCPGDCVISVPYASRLRIGNVGGDCNLKDIGEQLTVEHIGGDCRMVETGAIELNTVGGDCLIQSADGDVTLHTIGGDLRIHEAGAVATVRVGGDCNLQQIRGSVACNQVDGDFRGRAIEGNVAIDARGDVGLAQIDGNIQVRADGNTKLAQELETNQSVNVNVRGDIRWRLPKDSVAQVHARSRGGLKLRNFELAIEDAHESHFTLGEADAQAARVNLDALGNITLHGVDDMDQPTDESFGAFGRSDDFGGFGVRIDDLADLMSKRLESRLAHLSHNLEERLSSSDDLAARIQEKVQNAMRQAENKIAKALEKAESRARRAEEEMARREARHAGRTAARTEGRQGNRSGNRQEARGPVPGSSFAYSYRTPPTPPAPPRPPKPSAVSEEERMRILRMVESGTISVEQAEKLLAALNQ
ncbi:MAG: hypothetical protein WDZ49_10165 [Litorilinea sp.]